MQYSILFGQGGLIANGGGAGVITQAGVGMSVGPGDFNGDGTLTFRVLFNPQSIGSIGFEYLNVSEEVESQTVLVKGNFIGLNAAGQASGNGGNGIVTGDGAFLTQIMGNFIAGQSAVGKAGVVLGATRMRLPGATTTSASTSRPSWPSRTGSASGWGGPRKMRGSAATPSATATSSRATSTRASSATRASRTR